MAQEYRRDQEVLLQVWFWWYELYCSAQVRFLTSGMVPEFSVQSIDDDLPIFLELSYMETLAVLINNLNNS